MANGVNNKEYIMGSHDYYKGQCKNCQSDCDGEFCSDSCAEEWISGKADYDYDRYKDRLLDDL